LSGSLAGQKRIHEESVSLWLLGYLIIDIIGNNFAPFHFPPQAQGC
jgi:hypothetical protein